MTSNHPLYFTIHGHFYQPPRENPWTGAIERQPSAHPHHDWNLRIAKECYGPNSASRILDPQGRIRELVNNYEYMSFNMGPTLLSWIRFQMPDVYARIQEADRKSVQRLGHGNAVAQVYNHIIMPLATREDRLTQIRWGIQDFEFHFGRKPEAMWLAETAINMDTVVDLIQEGIRYTILSPTQAESFRSLGAQGERIDGDWQDASNTDIDTTRAYRIFPRDEHGNKLCEGHLDVFFYHPWLSGAVGFEHLLRSAEGFGNRIRGAWVANRQEPQLISIATDGESYGHHEAFGDMCAAWLFKHFAAEKEMVPVNYGWYLEQFPPKHEAQIKNAHGEGCAWSCAHGVGRWYRDCGCSTGGPDTWNQAWRGPLRDAVNYLKSKADDLFLGEMPRLTVLNPWEVRDRYIQVLLHPGNKGVRHGFLASVLSNPNSESDAKDLLSLLEIQKFSMFSFTSCGWFFNDIEGIEPVQNLRYALRAMELMRGFSVHGTSLEIEFLAILARAKSNATGRNGAEIFATDVRQEVPAWLRLVGEAAVRLHMQLDNSHSFELDSFHIQVVSLRHDSHSSLLQCHLELSDTGESYDAGVLVMSDALDRTHLFMIEGESAAEKIAMVTADLSVTELRKKLPRALYMRMKDLFADSLERINLLASTKNLRQLSMDFRDFASRYSMSLDCLADASGALPGAMRESLAVSLNAELYRVALKALDQVDKELLRHAKELVDEVHGLGIRPALTGMGTQFNKRILSLLKLSSTPQASESVTQITGLITLADWMGVDIDKNQLENEAYPLYLQFGTAPKSPLRPMFDWLNFHGA